MKGMAAMAQMAAAAPWHWRGFVDKLTLSPVHKLDRGASWGMSGVDSENDSLTVHASSIFFVLYPSRWYFARCPVIKWVIGQS